MKISSIGFFFRLIILISILFPLWSCTNNPEVKDDDAKATEALAGVWRGDGTYEDEEDAGWAESWKIVRGSDGTYEVDYMIVHDGDKLYEKSSDAGTWMYKNGVYTEVNSNGDNVTYDVFSVKTDWFEYNIAQREGSANIQESKTVDDFQLQGPPEGYSEVSYELPDELPSELLDEMSVETPVESPVE
ncbi:MAG: lipocalin family protein [Gammaproteobacteria bacterium]